MKSLEAVASIDQAYGSAAVRVIAQASTFDAEVGLLATQLIIDVVEGAVSVDELRGGVRWANDLARETFACDYSDSVNEHEVLARRILHKSGRLALNAVKTQVRLTTMRAAYDRTIESARSQLIEDNQKEIRALRLENLVQYVMKEGK